MALIFLPTAAGVLRSGRSDIESLEMGWEGVVRQSHPDFCGPAVIATLLSQRGASVSDVEVANGANISPGGVTLAEFERLSHAHGLPGRWFRVRGGTDLASLPLPFVVHLRGSSGHFAIVERTLPGFIQLADPARGRVLMPEELFEREWSGRVFLFDLARAATPNSPR